LGLLYSIGKTKCKSPFSFKGLLRGWQGAVKGLAGGR